jgi:hypothetical protein
MAANNVIASPHSALHHRIGALLQDQISVITAPDCYHQSE